MCHSFLNYNLSLKFILNVKEVMDLKQNILVADDDAMLRRLLSDMLKKNGYEVVLAENGQESLDFFFGSTDFQLCILDVMMPIYTGYEVLETIREHSEVPIIMLTALGEESSELKGLQRGADDYIAKPFSYDVLLARVNNILKKELKNQEKVLEFGNITLDQRGHSISVDGTEVTLNPKEYALFSLFATHSGQVFTREQLLSNIWGYDYEGEIRTVDTHVKMLRKKLGNYGETIVTVRGTGYKFQVKP